MKLQELSTLQQEVLSHIKARVILGLMEVLTDRDGEARSLVERQRFTLQVQVIGGPVCHVKVENGTLTFIDARCPLPSLSLLFLSPLKMNQMFSGYKQNPLPLVGSFKFPGIIKSFRKLSARLSYFMEGEGREARDSKVLVTELLLYAAVFGVSAVGEYDEYVRTRVEHMADGVLEVRVAGDGGFSAWLEKKGPSFSVRRVESSAGNTANAVLQFNGIESAFDVLTGSKNAMAALGTGEVQIRGRLPMIQTVFQLLDRVGFYMAVK